MDTAFRSVMLMATADWAQSRIGTPIRAVGHAVIAH
jgi:hypothetical protein